jgi:hypothetical protein
VVASIVALETYFAAGREAAKTPPPRVRHASQRAAQHVTQPAARRTPQAGPWESEFGPPANASPDGTRLAVGSRDGTVRVYVIPVDELTAIARSRLTQGWTRAECAQYLPGDR